MQKLRSFFLVVNLLVGLQSFGASKLGFDFIDQGQSKSVIPIQIYNNLVILPLRINESDTLNFILDSGAENTILLSSGLLKNPLNELHSRMVMISGLGNESKVEANVSIGNTLFLNNIIGENITIIEIEEDLTLSQMFGLPIHGIIGAELFRYFVVKIDYRKKTLTLYKHGFDDYGRKYKTLPIEIHDNKPYITDTKYNLSNRSSVQLKMLLDLGESKPISIFIGTNDQLEYPDQFVFSNLGKGLSGTISGYITRSKSFAVDKFNFKNIITSYPDEKSLQFIDFDNGRNGSIGSGLLKRFVVILDYQNEIVSLKKNGRVRAPFYYDRTGLILKASGEDLTQFRIAEIINFTPAFFSALKENDLILKINNEAVEGKKLVEVNELLNTSKNRKTMRITIMRDGKAQKLKLYLFDFI